MSEPTLSLLARALISSAVGLGSAWVCYRVQVFELQAAWAREEPDREREYARLLEQDRLLPARPEQRLREELDAACRQSLLTREIENVDKSVARAHVIYSRWCPQAFQTEPHGFAVPPKDAGGFAPASDPPPQQIPDDVCQSELLWMVRGRLELENRLVLPHARRLRRARALSVVVGCAIALRLLAAPLLPD